MDILDDMGVSKLSAKVFFKSELPVTTSNIFFIKIHVKLVTCSSIAKQTRLVPGLQFQS